MSTAFVLGNGVSRKDIELEPLQTHGKIYGCNALYRHFEPDYLIAVDIKMIREIAEHGYQHSHQVWTNPSPHYEGITDLNFFKPNKGWSSGPTALWMASEHDYKTIYILGFDYVGLNEGQRFNNIYADSQNYKRSTDRATFHQNWLKQTTQTIQQHPHITYYRVIDNDFKPQELSKLKNLRHISVEKFKKSLFLGD